MREQQRVFRGKRFLGVRVGRVYVQVKDTRFNPVVWDSGLSNSPKWTLEAKNGSQRFETWGIPESDLYFQGSLARAQTVIH